MLGALASVLIIWAVTGVLLYEAVHRIMHPGHTDGKGVLESCRLLGSVNGLHMGRCLPAVMFFFALGGIAVNLLNFAILGHAPKLRSGAGGHCMRVGVASAQAD